MPASGPLSVMWWLVSRASGTLALGLVSLSVVLGLAMAARVLRHPATRRTAAALHQHLALIAVCAIAVHGLALLGDHWLRPGPSGILVPFALSYRRAFTGIGISAGYLVLLLGPSFYLRRQIGARRWRLMHRGILLAWAMAAVHTLGSGSDAGRIWLRALVLAPVAPIVYLLVVRLLHTERRGSAARHLTRPVRARHSRPLLDDALPPS